MKLRFLDLNHYIHDSWGSFFIINKSILEEIEKCIYDQRNNICPNSKDIFKVFKYDLCNVKYIILGQDPYFQKGKASGQAFEISGFNNWNMLKNDSFGRIVKAAFYYKYQTDLQKKDLITKLQSACKPKLVFVKLLQNGVLLLNTALTCEQGKAGSHLKQWNKFTKNILKYINCCNNDATWFLWGKKAQNIFDEAFSNNAPEKIVRSAHPRYYNIFKKESGLKIILDKMKSPL